MGGFFTVAKGVVYFGSYDHYVYAVGAPTYSIFFYLGSPKDTSWGYNKGVTINNETKYILKTNYPAKRNLLLRLLRQKATSLTLLRASNCY